MQRPSPRQNLPVSILAVALVALVLAAAALAISSDIPPGSSGGGGGGTVPNNCPSSPQQYAKGISDGMGTLVCAQVQFSQLGGSLACQTGYYAVTISSSLSGTTGCAKFDYQCPSNQFFYNVSSSQSKCSGAVTSLQQGSDPVLTGPVVFLNSSNIGIHENGQDFIWAVTSLSWSLLTSFPVGCSSGPPQQFVETVGSTLTCAVPSTNISSTSCGALSAVTSASASTVNCGADPTISSTSCAAGSAVVQGATTTLSCSAVGGGGTISSTSCGAESAVTSASSTTVNCGPDATLSSTSCGALSAVTSGSNTQINCGPDPTLVSTSCGAGQGIVQGATTTISCSALSIPYSQITNFPAACSVGSFVFQLSSSITCVPADTNALTSFTNDLTAISGENFFPANSWLALGFVTSSAPTVGASYSPLTGSLADFGSASSTTDSSPTMYQMTQHSAGPWVEVGAALNPTAGHSATSPQSVAGSCTSCSSKAVPYSSNVANGNVGEIVVSWQTSSSAAVSISTIADTLSPATTYASLTSNCGELNTAANICTAIWAGSFGQSAANTVTVTMSASVADLSVSAYEVNDAQISAGNYETGTGYNSLQTLMGTASLNTAVSNGLSITYSQASNTLTFGISSIAWSLLTGFPGACAAGTVVTAVGASLTCSAAISSTSCAASSAITSAFGTTANCGAELSVSSTSCAASSAVTSASGTAVTCGPMLSISSTSCAASSAVTSASGTAVTCGAELSVSSTSCGVASAVTSASGTAVTCGAEVTVASTTVSCASQSYVTSVSASASVVNAVCAQPIIEVGATTTQKMSTTTFTTINALQAAVAASTTYEVQAYIPYSCSATEAAFFGMTGPAGMTINDMSFIQQLTASVSVNYGETVTSTSVSTATCPTGGQPGGVFIDGTITTGVTSGTFGFLFAGGTAATTITIDAGPWLHLYNPSA